MVPRGHEQYPSSSILLLNPGIVMVGWLGKAELDGLGALIRPWESTNEVGLELEYS